MAASSDPLFESVQRLQPMLDAFNKSLSELRKTTTNKAEALVLRKDLEGYYGELQKDLLSRYETLKQKEKAKFFGIKMPKNEPEEKGQKEGEKKIGRISLANLLAMKVLPKMESLCNDSDGVGLRNYLVNNIRALAPLCNELPAALRKAKDPAILVLKAIEGFEFSESGSTRNEKKESDAAANRRSCIKLLECLFPVLGSDENVVVAKEVQDKAREMARVWKKKMGLEKTLESANKVDVHGFLQLLVTFRIGKDFGQDELCEMLMRIASFSQSPVLALFLGLSAKMPDFVDKLSKNGKWIEAIRYAYAFRLMDKVNPTDLLKAYLEDAEKAIKDILKKGRGEESSLNDSRMREISAISTVIKVVKDYNLEDLYPLDDLQNRLKRLKNIKGKKKNAAEHKLSKKQRSRANKKKAAASTPKKKRAIVTTPEKKNNAAEAKSDKKNASAEKERLKRPRSSEPGSGNVGLIGAQGPEDLGLYRPSQRAKYASEWEMNNADVDKGMVPRDISLFQSKHGISRHDRYQSSYHGDNRSAVGPLMYRSCQTGAFATPSSLTVTQNNERRGYDGYPSAFGSSNINPVGSSFYGSSAATGAPAVSSFNPARGNYDGRGLQSYTSTFGGVDKSSLTSSMYDIDALANSSSSLVRGNYDKRGPELNTSAFGGDNLSNIGSSVYGSNRSSDPNNWKGKRGLEQYIPALGAGNMRPIDSSVYGSGASSVPSSNIYGSGASSVPSSNIYGSGASALLSSNLYGSATSAVLSSNVYGPGISTVPSSSITQRCYESREVERHNLDFATSIRSDYGSVASAGGLTGQSALNKYQFTSGLRF